MSVPRIVERLREVRYQVRRLAELDMTEWVDVARGLRAVGVRPGSTVVDVGGGCCLLSRYLSGLGYRTVCCDVDTSCGATYCDAASGSLPNGDAYVLVHVLEHLPWPSGVVRFLRAAWPKPIVAIVPGHVSDDATHSVNHFTHHVNTGLVQVNGRIQVLATVRELVAVFRHVGYLVRLFPDTHSLVAPWDNDWIILAHPTTTPKNPHPGLVRLAHLATRVAAKLTWLLTGVHKGFEMRRRLLARLAELEAELAWGSGEVYKRCGQENT